MPVLRSKNQRRGALTVEFAVTSFVAFFLIFAIIVGALGVFRYHEVAHLAREGARYATTHGAHYTNDNIPTTSGVPAVTSSTQVRDYIVPRSTLLDGNRLTVTTSWSAPNTMTPSNLPYYLDTDPTLVPPAQKTIRNYVTVTVSYQWMPEIFLVGPITLRSTSTMPMSY